MPRSLFERMMTWTRLFTQRPDVEEEVPLCVKPPGAQAALDDGEPQQPREKAPYPPDAAGFAAKAEDFAFHFRLTDATEQSYLFLNLSSDRSDAYIDLDGCRDRAKEVSGADAVLEGEVLAYELDNDRTGTGLAAFMLFPENGRPFILWDLDGEVVFESLTQYLTLGAQRGFMMGGKVWQTCRKGRWSDEPCEKAVQPLRQRSLPATTPPEKLLSALVAQGASQEEAMDLLEWLGPDASLLVALPMDDVRRLVPGWYAEPQPKPAAPEKEEGAEEGEEPEAPRTRRIAAGAKAGQVSFADEDLSNADFSDCDCSGVSFANANAGGALFAKARLDQADFSGAELGGADFRGASLRGCSFRKAKLRDAVFDQADCTGADFTGAELEGDVRFAKACLDGARRDGALLEARVRTILHRGLKKADLPTLAKATGQLTNRLLGEVLEKLSRVLTGEERVRDELFLERPSNLGAEVADALAVQVAACPARGLLLELLGKLDATLTPESAETLFKAAHLPAVKSVDDPSELLEGAHAVLARLAAPAGARLLPQIETMLAAQNAAVTVNTALYAAMLLGPQAKALLLLVQMRAAPAGEDAEPSDVDRQLAALAAVSIDPALAQSFGESLRDALRSSLVEQGSARRNGGRHDLFPLLERLPAAVRTALAPELAAEFLDTESKALANLLTALGQPGTQAALELLESKGSSLRKDLVRELICNVALHSKLSEAEKARLAGHALALTVSSYQEA
ncbi:MAG: pentapeptide repeat-containing protein [Myxococcales bacterium]